jgi:transcriptional regulator with XRE-family HTH domain
MEEIPIGKAIARARQRKRWTQEDLARVVGVSRPTVADWERGEHYPLRYLGAIEEALGIDLNGYESETAAS